jgi:transcriptional regulator with XRE-family HTH domain
LGSIKNNPHWKGVFMDLLGQDIATVRKRAGYTQEKFAQAIGVSVSALRIQERIEDGRVGGIVRNGFFKWLMDQETIPPKFRYEVEKLRKKEKKVVTEQDIRKEIEEKLGYLPDVVATPDDSFVVEYLNLNIPPPPVAQTPHQSYAVFLDYLKAHKIDNRENTDDADKLSD